MAFMIYGADSRRDAFENYEKEIEKSYDEIFYRLEHLYSEADRKDDKLFDVVADFASFTTIYILKQEYWWDFSCLRT